jgi:peptide/nickel transport system substrate-binding protein
MCSRPQWGEAIQNYLTAVGIRAKINQLQVGRQIQKAQKGELALLHGKLGFSYSINDVSAILPVYVRRPARSTTMRAIPS